MENINIAAIVTILIVILWYIISMILAVTKKGLDPSLLTYVSPLCWYKCRLFRIVVAASLFLGLLSHGLALTIGMGIAVFTIVHLFLLFAFNRTATQPTAYYVTLAVSACILTIPMPKPLLFVVLVIAIVAQELLLKTWIKSKQQRYNHWVAGEVRQIHNKYHPQAGTILEREWFFVLHFAVTESIARPKLSRFIERAYFYIRRPASITTGIMQVKANKPLSNKESMRRGSEIISQALRSMPPDITMPKKQLVWLADLYNGNDAVKSGYLSCLLSTYPGLMLAWQDIKHA